MPNIAQTLISLYVVSFLLCLVSTTSISIKGKQLSKFWMVLIHLIPILNTIIAFRLAFGILGKFFSKEE